MLTSLTAIVWASGVVHLARYFGASELTAVAYAIAAAIAYAATAATQIVGRAVDALDPKLDAIIEELRDLRKNRRDHY